MSEITPYINQDSWGKDLLNRLNNIGDDNGGFNVWDELPTQGKDGEILGESHKGYSGILLGEQPSIQRWTGISWEELIRVPVGFRGEPVETQVIATQSTVLSVLDPGFSYDFLFTLTGDESGSFYVRKYDKNTGGLLWATTVQCPTGFNTPYIPEVLNRYRSWDLGGGNLFLGMYFTPSIINVPNFHRSLYCFSISTGTMQWNTQYGTESGYLLIANVFYKDSSTLYAFLSGYDSRIINPVTGTQNSSTSIGAIIPGNNYYQATFATNSGDLVMLTSPVPLLTTLTKVSPNLSTSLFQQQFPLNQGVFGEVHFYNFVQDPQNKDLFYFYDQTSQSKIWRYNAANNSFVIAALFPVGISMDGLIIGIHKEDEDYFIATWNKVAIALYKTRMDGGEISFNSVKVSGGKGDVVFPIQSQINSTDFTVTKLSKARFGYAQFQSVKSEISLSPSNKQIVFYSDSAFSSSSNLSKIEASSTFEDIKCTSLSTPVVSSSFLSVSDSTPFNQTTEATCQNPDNGIAVGNIGYLFSFHHGSRAISNDSQSYNSAGSARFVFGLGFNAKPVAGRFVKTNSISYSAIQLFDCDLGKMLWDTAVNPGTPVNSLITNLPSANPAITLAHTKKVGFSNFSPTYEVDVTGTMRATEVRNSGGVITSDPRMKLNMKSLDGGDSWEIINHLDAITFLYKPDFAVTVEETGEDEEGNEIVSSFVQHWPLPQGIQVGYNADLVGEVLPELVDIESRSGIKYLNAGAIAPIVHQGTVWKINQLQQIIEQQQTRLDQVEQTNQQQQTLIESLTARVEALENAA